MTGVLITGAGFWSPLVWLAAFLIVLAIVLLIRSTGRKKFRHGTDQTAAFFSGNEAPKTHVKAGNIYWGFFVTTGRYYRWLRRMHTGIVNDYVYSFVLIMVILLAAVTMGGLL
jgi:hypothetical protein